MSTGVRRHPLQQLAKPWRQRVAQDLFNRAVRPAGLIVLTPARGSPQQHPVGGPVTRAAKTFRIDEGLQKIDRVPIGTFPVWRQPASHAAEDVRGQVRRRHPGQNQKARVIGEETDVAPPRFAAPADVAVAAPQMTRRRTPRQARQWTPLRPHQIFQVLADRLLVPQVMVGFHQAVEQRLIRGAPHELDFNRAQRLKRHGQRRGVDQDRLWPGTPRPALPSDLTAHGRQLDLARPLQLQQQAAAYHVAQRSVGLFPTQRFA